MLPAHSFCHSEFCEGRHIPGFRPASSSLILPHSCAVLHATASQHPQTALGAPIRMETPSCKSSCTRAQSRLLPAQARLLCTSVICLPASDRRGLPASESGLVCGPSTTETLWKRVPLSHVLHRRRKTISASSLGPRLAPLCTAPTHEHSYYVNWALDRGISATTPGHNTGSRANARPSMPRQSSPRSRGGLQGSLVCFHIILQRRGGQNKRRARARARARATSPEPTRACCCFPVPGYLC